MTGGQRYLFVRPWSLCFLLFMLNPFQLEEEKKSDSLLLRIIVRV